MSDVLDPELLKTLHVHLSDVPYVQLQPGIETRVLQARLDDELLVTELRAQPGAQSSLHRHLSAVFGLTIEGTWGHDHQYAYRPFTYVYETPGVVHRFMNGPDVTEALFISQGPLEWIDETSGEVAETMSAETMLTHYLETCEALGLPRGSILH